MNTIYESDKKEEDDLSENRLGLLKLIETRNVAAIYYANNSKSTVKIRNEFYDYDEVNGRIIQNIAIKMTERKK